MPAGRSQTVRIPDAFSAASKTILLGTVTASFIVALDRARVTAPLAPAFAQMSAAEHVMAVVVAIAGLALVLTSLDLALAFGIES